MGLNDLQTFPARHGRVALDTSLFIYQFQPNPKYLLLTRAIFSWLRLPGSAAITSTITMTELLVQPYRAGNERMADEFYGLLTTFPNLQWVSTSLEIAELAAKFRADHRLQRPDAIQAATAVHGQASGLLTDDPVFRRIGVIETLLLDDLL